MLLSRKGVFMVFYADAHCDTLIYAKKKGSSLFDHPGHVNLKMLESLSDKFLQFMAIWINPKHKNIKKRAMEVIGFYKEQEKDIAGKINGGLILSIPRKLYFLTWLNYVQGRSWPAIQIVLIFVAIQGTWRMTSCGL